MTVDFNRYQRQTVLDGFGLAGQTQLAKSRVLVVGLGGLGIPVVQYLNAMGVGTLGLVENDTVDLQNLQRQVLYQEKDIGRKKLAVALERLAAQNSQTHLVPYESFLTQENALALIQDYDVVVDATDNFPSRYLINDACTILKKPFVYGALHGFEGQVAVFNYKGGPTYRCLFPNPPVSNNIPNCNDHGVLGIVPGIIGNFQALETIKILTGIGTVLAGQLLLYNGLSQTSQKIQLRVNPENYERTALESSYGTPSCVQQENVINIYDFLSRYTQDQVQLVDVRTAEEYQKDHLTGAVNLPVDDLESGVGLIDLKRSVYLICQSGKRSGMAQQRLQQQYPETSFFQLEGGMAALTKKTIQSS
ncbi:MAG: HesA/MoeB/ThiF family protein [Bacteroidota bacterium]